MRTYPVTVVFKSTDPVTSFIIDLLINSKSFWRSFHDETRLRKTLCRSSDQMMIISGDFVFFYQASFVFFFAIARSNMHAPYN